MGLLLEPLPLETMNYDSQNTPVYRDDRSQSKSQKQSSSLLTSVLSLHFIPLFSSEEGLPSIIWEITQYSGVSSQFYSKGSYWESIRKIFLNRKQKRKRNAEISLVKKKCVSPNSLKDLPFLLMYSQQFLPLPPRLENWIFFPSLSSTIQGFFITFVPLIKKSLG